jgi:hypothetical protein
MDWAKVSLGESEPDFKPYDVDDGDSGADEAAGFTNLTELLPSSIHLY